MVKEAYIIHSKDEELCESVERYLKYVKDFEFIEKLDVSEFKKEEYFNRFFPSVFDSTYVEKKIYFLFGDELEILINDRLSSSGFIFSIACDLALSKLYNNSYKYDLKTLSIQWENFLSFNEIEKGENVNTSNLWMDIDIETIDWDKLYNNLAIAHGKGEKFDEEYLQQILENVYSEVGRKKLNENLNQGNDSLPDRNILSDTIFVLIVDDVLGDYEKKFLPFYICFKKELKDKRKILILRGVSDPLKLVNVLRVFPADILLIDIDFSKFKIEKKKEIEEYAYYFHKGEKNVGLVILEQIGYLIKGVSEFNKSCIPYIFTSYECPSSINNQFEKYWIEKTKEMWELVEKINCVSPIDKVSDTEKYLLDLLIRKLIFLKRYVNGQYKYKEVNLMEYISGFFSHYEEKNEDELEIIEEEKRFIINSIIEKIKNENRGKEIYIGKKNEIKNGKKGPIIPEVRDNKEEKGNFEFLGEKFTSPIFLAPSPVTGSTVGMKNGNFDIDYIQRKISFFASKNYIGAIILKTIYYPEENKKTGEKPQTRVWRWDEELYNTGHTPHEMFPFDKINEFYSNLSGKTKEKIIISLGIKSSSFSHWEEIFKKLGMGSLKDIKIIEINARHTLREICRAFLGSEEIDEYGINPLIQNFWEEVFEWFKLLNKLGIEYNKKLLIKLPFRSDLLVLCSFINKIIEENNEFGKECGIRGITLINTIKAPHIPIIDDELINFYDEEKIKIQQLSGGSLRGLRNWAIKTIHKKFPKIEISASGGIFSEQDILECKLFGAKTFQLASYPILYGIGKLEKLYTNTFGKDKILEKWGNKNFDERIGVEGKEKKFIPKYAVIDYQKCQRCGKCLKLHYCDAFINKYLKKDMEINGKIIPTKFYPIIEEEYCVGCGLCVQICPQRAIKLVRENE